MLTVRASKTKFNLRAAGMPVTNFGLIVGVTPSSMRSAMAGVAYLGSELELSHYEASCKILALTEAMLPFRLEDWQTWKWLLENDVEPDSIKSWVTQILRGRE